MHAGGVFILRKNGKEKGLRMESDAYPSRGGRCVVDMIKGTDLGKLFGLMEEDLESDCDRFDREQLEYHALKAEKLVFRNRAGLIQDSVLCEHGYVIDLDEEVLEYYEGFQEDPDPGNRYGTHMQNGCYPCKKVTSFSLGYVKSHGTAEVVNELGEDAFFEDEESISKEGLGQNITSILGNLAEIEKSISAIKCTLAKDMRH